MKTKFLLPLALLCGAMGVSQARADGYSKSQLTSDGWTKVTDISALTLADNYFIIADADEEYVLHLAEANKNVAGNKSLYYQAPVDPLTDVSQVFKIESRTVDANTYYALRNLSCLHYCLQTHSGKYYLFRTNWETAPSEWCDVAFEEYDMDNHYFKIRNVKGGATYLGSWGNAASSALPAADGGYEVAGNRASGDTGVGKYALYYISRSTFQTKYQTKYLSGWTQVTGSDITAENTAQNYYMILDADELFSIALKDGVKQSSDTKALYYQTIDDPYTDLAQVWKFETRTVDAETRFAMRCYDYPNFLLQTESKNYHFWHTHDQAAACEWTDIAFEEYDTENHYFNIKNVKGNLYLGSWGNLASSALPATTASGGYELAGNRGSGDAGLGKYKLYSVSRTTFEAGLKAQQMATACEITNYVVNPTCESALGGWFTNDAETTGAGYYSAINTWKNQVYADNSYLDCNSNGTVIRQTLNAMPAGYYKVVAALRSQSSGQTITVGLNDATGTVFHGDGDRGTGIQINHNGVQMPWSGLGGFHNSNDKNRSWQWGSAQTQLAEAGSLTIKFTIGGGNWHCIDDIHLYYSPNGYDDFYQITDANNTVPNGKLVTCDIVLENPNTIISSSEAITTAASTTLNNNLVGGTIGKLVFYDGYDTTIPSAFNATAATLYRSVAASSFATVCAPFAITGGAGVDGTFYEPSSLENGVLSFTTPGSKVAGGAYLYKSSSAVTSFTGSGTVATAPTNNGTGVQMKGTYTNITAVPEGAYVLSGTNLYKVDTEVSAAPFRAYFVVPGTNNARIAMAFTDDEASAVQSVAVSQQPTNRVFDLQGRRVAQPTRPGLYIINGKKIIIK